MSTPTAPQADTINLVELVQALRRGWRALVVCTALGAAAGTGVLLFAPRRFSSAASVVVRSNSSSSASSMLTRLGLGDAVPGITPSSTIETESAILSSRELMGEVIDSLRLQTSITSPRSLAGRQVFASVHLANAFRKARYQVTRDAGGQFRLESGDVTVTAPAARPIVLPQGTLAFRTDTSLPPRFTLVLLDREDALADAQKRLSVAKTTGSDVITVAFQAPDSATAAAVPNLLIADYLVRRHTVDRGTNEYRVAFLTSQLDTVGRALSAAEDSLRRFQERTGLLQPDTQGKLQLDEASTLRAQLGAIDVERGALDQLSAQITSGAMTPRQLAAYPSFLRSAAINELLAQLVKIETDRTQLLQTRLETDRDVVGLTSSARNVEAQLAGLAAGYRTTLDRQRHDVGAQLDTITRTLGTYPGAVESSGRLQRHTKELAQTYAALQAQLVDARLAAIGEGGDVRLLDGATPPKKPAFPRPVSTLGIGAGAGVLVGVVLALYVGLLGRYVEDPHAIERTTGVPALRFDESVPLLVTSPHASHTLLLLPLYANVNTAGVAERLVRTAVARGSEAIVLDLSDAARAPAATATELVPSVSAAVQQLERDHDAVIVRLPALSSEHAAAALTPNRAVVVVAPPGRLERRRLVDTIHTLRRLDIPVAGVVVNRVSDVRKA